MSEQDVDSQPTGRAHCFVFVHDALPSVLSSDRERFVDRLRGPNAQSALDTLWASVAEVIVERGLGAVLPPTGLAAEAVDGNGWRGVVIRMPKVEQLGECSLVLIVIPNDPVKGGLWPLYRERDVPLARLFVLKLLQLPHMDAPGLRICEISPLLGHITTGYTCAESAADFVREVVDRLDLE